MAVDPLLPIRHPDAKDNWFICDFSDVIPKSDIASMEHPLFTLSTRADKKIRYYEHNGNTVTIVPSILGHSTIHDKDILIYSISQLRAGMNRGREPNRKVRFKAHDLLITTNRQTSGQGYKLLRQALDRLAGTLITTDIKTNNKQIVKGFGIIDSYEIIVDDPETKRMVELEVTLSEWLYNSVVGEQVLSISRDYFRIRKPIERRVYEIARKHCGKKRGWKIGIKKLHKKVGAVSPINKFKKSLNHIIEHNHLPDYSLSIESHNVVFTHTGNVVTEPRQEENSNLQLKPQTIKNAKKILQQQYDVYALEAEWRAWWESTGKPKLDSPDGAFINFCKKRMPVNNATSVVHGQTRKLTVPNIRDGSQLQEWAVSNGLPVAPVGYETIQYYRLLCNCVEKINSAQERIE